MRGIGRTAAVVLLAVSVAACGSEADVVTQSAPPDVPSTPTTSVPTEPATAPPTDSGAPTTATADPPPSRVDTVVTTTDSPSTTEPAPPTDPPAGDEAWQRVEIGTLAADGALAIARADGRTVVFFQSSPQSFESAVLTDGGMVTVSTQEAPTAGGEPTFLPMREMVSTRNGFFAFSADHPSMLPIVLHSADGGAWSEAITSGLDRPADLTTALVTDEWLIAGGALRTGPDPSQGPFEHALWRSADGITWEPVVIEGAGGGAIRDLAAAPDALVAIGHRDGGGAAAWRSVDDGATWTSVELGLDLGELASLATFGGDVFALAGTREGPMGRSALVRSTDSGQTWSMVPVDELVFDGIEAYASEIVSSGGALWISGSRFFFGFDDPDACYRDLDRCRGGSRAVLLRSADGERWDEVDLSVVQPERFLRVHRVAQADDRLVLVVSDPALAVWTWPSRTAPPLLPPPTEPEPLDTPLVRWGAEIEPGTLYRYPLSIHCGMEFLGEFNGQAWARSSNDSGPSPETGAGDDVPAHWPEAQQTIFGYLTMVDADTIEYSIGGGEVIATYEPTSEEIPGCA